MIKREKKTNKEEKRIMRKKRLRGRRNVRGRKGAYEENNIEIYSENIPSHNQPVSDKLFVKKIKTVRRVFNI